MKNTFKFSYLTPTPDTLANIALCRWNDALKGLPAFIQIYMQSQHFLQGFGFSRALSYKEYLNKKINRNTDLKVYVGGYEINLSELLVDNDLDLVKLVDGHYNLATFFRITFDTEEVLLDSNFISHDGSSIPVTEQNITITVELCYSDDTNWNSETQRPLSNLKGNSASAFFDMDIDDNSDGLYGRDCTLWTTPTEKTIYGYRWQCAIPISFLMPDNESVSNIYFDRNSGEFESLYAVPVVKRFFQNIEKAIYDTHLLNCLHDYGKTEEEIDEEHNEYVVVGGVNLDEDTENLYPVPEDTVLASTTSFGYSKIDVFYDFSESTKNGHVIDAKYFNDGLKYIFGNNISNGKINVDSIIANNTISGKSIVVTDTISGENSVNVKESFKIYCNNKNLYNITIKYSGDSNNPTFTARYGQCRIYTTDSAQVGSNPGDDAEILIIGTHKNSNNTDNSCLSLYRKPSSTYPAEYYWNSYIDYIFEKDIFPKINVGSNIGSSEKRFNKTYTDTLYVRSINGSPNAININSTTYFQSLRFLVSPNKEQVFNKDGITSYSDNTFTIGTNDIPIATIHSKKGYFSEIYGVYPTVVASTLVFPVGAICLAMIPSNSWPNGNYDVGHYFSNNGSTIQTTTLDGSVGDYLPEGSYVLLSKVIIVSNQSSICLIQRKS